jgi:catechol 2,3-dioxygenase
MSGTTLKPNLTGHPRFSPRRLGHANLFVGDLKRSMIFYNKVVGLEEVRREPGISAGFLSNGSTHHDVGMVEVSGEERVGMGGHMQIPKGRGKKPDLNHLGWEMENEAELVSAYRRALAAEVPIHRRANHQISHSIYLFDPDGNLNEFYADALKDWRSIFNPSREDLVTSEWDVDGIVEADSAPKYDANPPLRRVADAVMHPLKVSHVVMVARNYPRMIEFYRDVGGLTPQPTSGEQVALMRGKIGHTDLAICPKAPGLEPGLHHVAFELESEADLVSAVDRLHAQGVDVEFEVDNPHKRSMFVRDPDGIRLEFCYHRRQEAGCFADQPESKLPYYV